MSYGEQAAEADGMISAAINDAQQAITAYTAAPTKESMSVLRERYDALRFVIEMHESDLWLVAHLSGEIDRVQAEAYLLLSRVEGQLPN